MVVPIRLLRKCQQLVNEGRIGKSILLDIRHFPRSFSDKMWGMKVYNDAPPKHVLGCPFLGAITCLRQTSKTRRVSCCCVRMLTARCPGVAASRPFMFTKYRVRRLKVDIRSWLLNNTATQREGFCVIVLNLAEEMSNKKEVSSALHQCYE